MAQHRPKFGRRLLSLKRNTEVCRILAKFGRCRPTLGHFQAKLVRGRPKDGVFLTEFGHDRAKPNVRIWETIDQQRAKFGPARPNVANHWPDWARIQEKSPKELYTAGPYGECVESSTGRPAIEVLTNDVLSGQAILFLHVCIDQ